MFDKKKALGKDGLKWMKVHLANLFGNNKIPHSERIQWTDDHIEQVREAVADPLDGTRWWADADEPFQGTTPSQYPGS